LRGFIKGDIDPGGGNDRFEARHGAVNGKVDGDDGLGPLALANANKAAVRGVLHIVNIPVSVSIHMAGDEAPAVWT
jgi:hypothetical protein